MAIQATRRYGPLLTDSHASRAVFGVLWGGKSAFDKPILAHGRGIMASLAWELAAACRGASFPRAPDRHGP
jgi:hypothetical protein